MPHSATISPGQCRAARGFLDWTQEELAERAAVSRGTVRDFEKGRHALHRSTETLLVQAFLAAGVTFLSADQGGPGVLFREAGEG
ncbi:helix-turn-helix transcriptional regulator [Azospirillum sp. SYSU D00513]|uniref:helix-turn-helix transcriptional regulator n=1 Tax=Azospirillum sp. SYSU D00513 TaxID=2812561 RepID=UPI001A96038D|nr:helix-turn-helix transcriptional regulator [Azospirillum sp. SYSU D00513]